MAPLAFLCVGACDRVPSVLQPIFVACVALLCFVYFMYFVWAFALSGYCTKHSRFGQTFSPPPNPDLSRRRFRRCPCLRAPPRSTLAAKIQGRQLSASPVAGATGNPPSGLRAASLPSSLSLTISPRSPSLGMGRGGHPPGMHTGEAPEGF